MKIRGSYIHHTEISRLLDRDVLFQANIRALCKQKPDAATFANVRNWLVRSAVARFRRGQNERMMREIRVRSIENELIAA